MTETQAVVDKKTKAVVQWRGTPVTIGFQDVKDLICSKATPQEVVIFLKTCEFLQLNPMVREIYLIKYDMSEPAAIVVAIESYLKVAEQHPQYDGIEAGIVLKSDRGDLEFREGALLLPGEESMLAGGWARVYRKDRGRPTYVAVSKAECVKYHRDGKPTYFWQESKQPWMLRKTALKRGLVEAFPSMYVGLLATSEVAGEMDGDFREIPDGTLPPGLVTRQGNPNWRKFWGKVNSDLGLTEDQARQLLHVESIKKDLIDQGWTMEQIWEALINAVQGQQFSGPEEEVVDAETGEIFPEEEKPPAQRDPESITTISDLTRACFKDFQMQPGDVVQELGYSSTRDITERPSECYRRIAATRRAG